MTKMEIIEIYENLAFNNDYIIGFELNKKVVACVLSLTAEMIDNITILGKSSSKNGGSSSIRFRPNKEQKEYIIRNSVKIDEIMEAEEFENLHKIRKKPTAAMCLKW